jgi:glycosyltransferase involved in cell wall biosynthesis
MCKVSVIVPVYNVENYIRDMLLSVQRQTFADFEAVIVNDGSTDGSQQIIDKFCREDERFRCFVKANGGVASARNKGLEKARGRYVVFYDPDDIIPEDSLEKMYAAAAAADADMVVGVMLEKSLGESLIYMHSQKLAKQKRISPLDRHFFGAWSLCNKMFSLDFLKKHDIRVEKISNAEDGVFTFCALNHAKRITGCDTIAYNYIKRPFWLAPSATQIISSRYLDGLLQSHDRILQEAKRLARKYLKPSQRKAYLEPLYIRFIEGEMINGYYRGIWRAQEDLTPKMTYRTRMYKEHVSEREWEKLLKRHEDIDLAKGFMQTSEMAAKPKVSIILNAKISSKQLNMILGSIYNQLFPLFEVLVPVEIYGKIDDVYRRKANLRTVDSVNGTTFGYEAMQAAKGEFVAVFNEFSMYTKNSLKQMVLKLMKEKNLDFVSVLMKRYDGENYEQIPCLSASYGYTRRGATKNSRLTVFDTFLSNKLFRKDVLSDFDFDSSTVKAVHKLYRTLNFMKLRKGVMITDMEEEEIISRSGYDANRTAIKVGFAVNEAVRKMRESLKRHITKEDLERFGIRSGR